ncbi:MAG: response regulator transcription factor [Dehalococcoidia bacterium]
MAKREGYRWSRGAWEPSPAERRVLDELATGRSNAEIAVRLELSPETVKSHVARLLGQTGCADRQALAHWWQSRRQQAPLLAPLLALLARFARAGFVAAAFGVVLIAIAGLASRGRDVPNVASSLEDQISTPVVTRARPPAAGGRYNIGPLIISPAGTVRAENRAAASAVSLAAGDLVQFPSGLRWEPPPGVGLNHEYGLVTSATVAGTKLYVWVWTGGDTVRFERLDDRTFRAVSAGAVFIWAEDTNRLDHPVAVDATGHLLLDPAPVAGSVVAIYGSGEGLDVSGMTMVGRLASVRRTQYPTEWYFNMCEAGRCGLSYRVGPLRAGRRNGGLPARF